MFYFKTNRDAPRYRVVRADLSQPRAAGAEPAWTETLPQREDVLVDATCVGRGRRLACVYMRHAQELLSLHELADGSLVQDVPLPDLGTITALRGRTEVRWKAAPRCPKPCALHRSCIALACGRAASDAVSWAGGAVAAHGVLLLLHGLRVSVRPVPLRPGEHDQVPSSWMSCLEGGGRWLLLRVLPQNFSPEK